MSNDKSKAVQIAEKLSPDLPTILRIDAEAAGDELRRLDAVNRELLEALQMIGDVPCPDDVYEWLACSGILSARAKAIAKATDV